MCAKFLIYHDTLLSQLLLPSFIRLFCLVTLVTRVTLAKETILGLSTSHLVKQNKHERKDTRTGVLAPSTSPSTPMRIFH